jgi:hypothetical protein
MDEALPDISPLGEQVSDYTVTRPAVVWKMPGQRICVLRATSAIASNGERKAGEP